MLEVADLEQQPHGLVAGKGAAERLGDAERILALGHAQHVAHGEECDVAAADAECAAIRAARCGASTECGTRSTGTGDFAAIACWQNADGTQTSSSRSNAGTQASGNSGSSHAQKPML